MPWASAMSPCTQTRMLAAKLAHRLDHLADAAAAGRMVAAQAAAVRCQQPSTSEDQVAVGDELARPPLQKPRVLELYEHCDGEAVADVDCTCR